ncbi:DUF3429 domain-containing protein [Brevundimonas sp.]|uniref:DUF3429 domain-containing protein n=1 Tax=Brevundimonas sp. TaxID=1871086 RepID=UPI0035681205
MTDRYRLPPIARVLGFAGLLPQAAAVAILIFGGPDLWFGALGLAYAYAALIFSFLGGVWWGLAAMARGQAPTWVWIAAVLPTLLTLTNAWKLATGSTWPSPALIFLGIFIAASLLVDLRLKAAGMTPEGWLTLRIPLSLGLGVLTLAAGLISAR